MGKLAGASVPAPVWARFMVKAEPIIAAARAEEAEERVIEISPAAEGVPEAPTPPRTPEVRAEEGEEVGEEGGEPLGGPNIVTKMICPKSGLLAGPHCPDAREVSYDVGAGSQPPTETCNIHTSGPAGEGEPGLRPSRSRRERAAETETVTLSVCAITGKLATSYCPIVVERKFDVQSAPTETCTRHGRRGTGP